MALTRRTVESIIVNRVGTQMQAAGLDGCTNNGQNRSLNEPMRQALSKLGVTASDPLLVNDTDVNTVATTSYEKLYDLTELFSLEATLSNLKLVDVQVGPRRENLSQLGKRLEDLVSRKRQQVEREHGISLGAEKDTYFRVLSIV